MSRRFLVALPLVLAPIASAQQPPAPGPEVELLKKDVGTWDANVEFWAAPNTPPSVSKGVSTISMLGPFWQVDEFKSEFQGEPFEGRGQTGYDPAKKKYVGVWVDSASSGLNLSESTYDPTTRTMAGWSEGPGPDGTPVKSRGVTEWKGPDTRVFSMYAQGPDSKEFLILRITYTRRK
jgi:hypothetical protein